jgi:type IV secretion system protein VirB9
MTTNALAESEAVLMPGDTHLVVYRYDPNNTYAVLGLPGVPTDIQLASDEKVLGFAMGDTVQWLIEELPGHLFIKPIKADLFTAGTLVTDRRVYQLAFKSTNAQGRWYQKVSWSYPEVALRSAHEAAVAPLLTDIVSPDKLDPATLNFAYDIEGEGDFKPITVFDDGRFTWLKVKAPQALPALFMVSEEGVQLVNYLIQGDYFVVQRLLPAALLKLGNTEVRITNRQWASRSKKNVWRNSKAANFE